MQLNPRRDSFVDFVIRAAAWLPVRLAAILAVAFSLNGSAVEAQQAASPIRITVKQAIRLALEHNHALQAARTTIQLSEAQEITANHFAASLIDFLDAARRYHANQLAYRQTLATYMTALEQLRQAVATRNLP